MKKMIWLTVFTCLCFSNLLAVTDPKETAKSYLQSFFEGDFEAMVAVQDETMRQLFGKQAIEQSFQAFKVNFGAFEAVLDIKESETQGYFIYLFYTKMQKAYLQITVSVDTQN
ncbi:MAG: hypothetical protein GXY29_08450, partial [Thermotogaceae bacterium]|nr:hypothetical protein [Thermotogaceae bacterium]